MVVKTDPDFLAEDFKFTYDLLIEHVRNQRQDLFHATCSNNFNIILAALKIAERETNV